MSNQLTLSGKYLTPQGRLEDGTVVVENGKIAQASEAIGTSSVPLPPGATILPGFIELQINGAFGVDLTEDPSGIKVLSEHLPERGVVAFLPTIITSPIDRYPELLAKTDLTPVPHGAVPLGLHLEGPFINPQRKGAHREAYICPPTPQNLEMLLDPAKVKIITLAPEMPHALDAIKTIKAAGVVPSSGHSMATYAQAQAGFEAGSGYAVHLFNAMPNLHHREPGLIGALLEPGAPTFGIIPDGIHSHPAILGLIYRSRGVEGITLVSDAMSAAGLGQGTHHLGDQDVIIDATSARLADGTLAGSIILQDDAVRNMVRFGICDLASAARMASETPARVIGLQDRKGKLAPGFDADLVVLDADLNVCLTVVNGEIAYQR